jgi:succinoglycan biosynthesis protein ExoH
MLRTLTAIAGIFGAWALSALLVRTAPGEALARLGGLSFWIFCAHYPLLVLFWMVWNRIGGADAYPLFYVASPLLALAVLVVSHAAARRFTPSLHAILTGRRQGRPRAPAGRRPHPPMEPNGSIAQRR